MSGDYNLLSAGSGDDEVIMDSGSVTGLALSEGDDLLTLKGGSISLLTGGNGDDIMSLTGGSVQDVNTGAGDDEIVLDGAATLGGAINGQTGRDTLTLMGTGSLDGAQFQNMEFLNVSRNANWRTATSATFSDSFLVNDGAAFEVSAGTTLSTGRIAVASGGTFAVNGTLDFNPGSVGLALAGKVFGDGTINNTASSFFFNVNPTGVIRPGNSIGTLTVNSETIFRAGSQLIAEIDPSAAQNADLLAVTGNVIGVDDLTIVVDPINAGADADAYVAANDYVVLTGTTLDGDAPTVVAGGNLPALADVSIVGTPSTSGQVALAFTKLPVTQLGTAAAVTQTGNPNHQNLATAVGVTAGGTGGRNRWSMVLPFQRRQMR